MRAGLKGIEPNMQLTVIKGIVHPEMLFLSLFTHMLSQTWPVLIYFMCWTQKMIFWRMWVTKQLLVHIDFDSRGKNTIEVTVDQQLFGFPPSK